MGVFYRNLVRPFLFRQEPEKAHEQAVVMMQYASHLRFLCRVMEKWNAPCARAKPVELMGLSFPNRIGLAAGMDKNAVCWPFMAALGFGHVEIGTVTAQKQPGNPRPRLFRFPAENAIINRMGFNNEGAEDIAGRLSKQIRSGMKRIPLGINIGKSKVTPLDRAVEDYLGSFNHLAPFADYIAINVSSPNTPDLRKLQALEPLQELFSALQESNRSRASKLGRKRVPLLVKIAPDLSYREVDHVLQAIETHGLDGIIATNTTISREGSNSRFREQGGLSGRPLHRKSIHMVNYIHRSTKGKLPIIGVGGIMNAENAGAMIDAGASLVQVYTGFIYRGPFFPAQVARALAPRQRDYR